MYLCLSIVSVLTFLNDLLYLSLLFLGLYAVFLVVILVLGFVMYCLSLLVSICVSEFESRIYFEFEFNETSTLVVLQYITWSVIVFMTAATSACLVTENPGRSPRTAVVAALADLALRVAAAVVAAGPVGRVGVEVLVVAALVAV